MLKKPFVILVVLLILLIILSAAFPAIKSPPKANPPRAEKNKKQSNDMVIKLPKPKYKSQISVEEAILKRRSVRDYKNTPLTLTEVSQLLWSAQGITEPTMGFRTAPSAGALYPLEIYLVVGNVRDLSPGIYKYKPAQHEMVKLSSADKREELYQATFGQDWVKNGAAVIIISAIFERTTQKYGERGRRYVHMEAGHTAQNVYLQAVSLNLGTVTVGAFSDEQVKRIVNLEDNEEPLIIMPVGGN
jgi:SagB-type dehydrogenase family enzyme